MRQPRANASMRRGANRERVVLVCFGIACGWLLSALAHSRSIRRSSALWSHWPYWKLDRTRYGFTLEWHPWCIFHSAIAWIYGGWKDSRAQRWTKQRRPDTATSATIPRRAAPPPPLAPRPSSNRTDSRGVAVTLLGDREPRHPSTVAAQIALVASLAPRRPLVSLEERVTREKRNLAARTCRRRGAA